MLYTSPSSLTSQPHLSAAPLSRTCQPHLSTAPLNLTSQSYLSALPLNLLVCGPVDSCTQPSDDQQCLVRTPTPTPPQRGRNASLVVELKPEHRTKPSDAAFSQC